MAWNTIQNGVSLTPTSWEYNDAPADPGGGQSALWAESIAGIRTELDGTQLYVQCRLIGALDEDMSEISKTYYDGQ